MDQYWTLIKEENENNGDGWNAFPQSGCRVQNDSS